MAFRPARLVGAFLVFLISAAAPAAAASASQVTTPPPTQFGIRLLEVPASEANDPRAKLYIIDRVAPGATVHHELQVSNEGSQPLTLSVYPAAASISNGVFQFAGGHIQNEMTTWITMSHDTVDLAPRASATLTATIAVPANAPSGSQYGVIWAQETGKGTGNVTMVNRVGIRLYLSIGAGGAPAPNFALGTPTSSRGPDGSPLVQVPVRNTGGVAVDVRGTAQLTDGPGGLLAGPFSATNVDTLAPGESHPETFELSSKLPEGPWQVSFTMVSGLINKTEKVTMKFNDNGATTTAAHKSFPIVPVASGIAVLVLLAAAALLITRSRRTHGARPAL
jgi:hypothetical protein